MTDFSLDKDDLLQDFDARQITLNEKTKRVYVAGQGPAVIVLTEMPGISPHVARFARWVRDAGFTVWMPSLFGRDGALPNAKDGAEIFRHACVSAEFRAFAGGGTSPVTSWLRALARYAYAESGGPGVGALGMCFTGNFALSMMLEPVMLAPVLAQPALPLDAPNKVESPAEELSAIKDRLEREDLTVLAYRFAGDNFCRAERFAAYAASLGDRFIGKVLPDASANTERTPFSNAHISTPHSVVTTDLIDAEGQPTRMAVDEILSFFTHRLKNERP